MFKALIAMLLGSESAIKTRKTYRQKRVEPQYIQDARIAVAHAKRDRKALALDLNTQLSARLNGAHNPGVFTLDAVPNRLNPFYINRSKTV